MMTFALIVVGVVLACYGVLLGLILLAGLLHALEDGWSWFMARR